MSASTAASAPAVLLLTAAARSEVCFAASGRAESFAASVRNWLTVADRPAAVAADLAACACASLQPHHGQLCALVPIQRAAVCAFASCEDSMLLRSARFFCQPRFHSICSRQNAPANIQQNNDCFPPRLNESKDRCHTSNAARALLKRLFLSRPVHSGHR